MIFGFAPDPHNPHRTRALHPTASREGKNFVISAKIKNMRRSRSLSLAPSASVLVSAPLVRPREWIPSKPHCSRRGLRAERRLLFLKSGTFWLTTLPRRVSRHSPLPVSAERYSGSGSEAGRSFDPFPFFYSVDVSPEWSPRNAQDQHYDSSQH